MSQDVATQILKQDGDAMGNRPHGWIQWKGTEVCIDLYCGCGESLHFDGGFLYSWKCPHCERHYAMGSHIVMYELTAEQSVAWGGVVKEPEATI